jgi:tripeptidyl-peptidase-1
MYVVGPNTGTVPILYSYYCTTTVLVLYAYSHCTHAVRILLYYYCTRTVLALYSYCTQTYSFRTHTVFKTVNPGAPTSEASLDIEYLTSMGRGAPSEFWSFPGTAPHDPENEPFLDFILAVANTSDATVPRVFSTSYGECEKSVDPAYMARIESEFQKAAARGISLLFASGDDGVGTGNGGVCPGAKFCAQWPAASPWVTAVGGTESVESTAEQGWGGSGGGFSGTWSGASAPHQEHAISAYLKTAEKLPKSSFYNASNCGYPDVSAQATGFTITYGGHTHPGIMGTSASTPTFSGLIGLLNDQRKGLNKPALGFLNPFLYQNAKAFNDITVGNNPGCSTKGFYAAVGWDPATGLGTPDFAKLAAAVAKLP